MLMSGQTRCYSSGDVHRDIKVINNVGRLHWGGIETHGQDIWGHLARTSESVAWLYVYLRAGLSL